MYQVGLAESDPHIQYFWSVLAGFSQEELGRFVKFACNQKRIPQMCPCMDGALDTAHVPPYPMKIAPPDGTGTQTVTEQMQLIVNKDSLLGEKTPPCKLPKFHIIRVF